MTKPTITLENLQIFNTKNQIATNLFATYGGVLQSHDNDQSDQNDYSYSNDISEYSDSSQHNDDCTAGDTSASAD
ncbi:hypothetical protein SAMN05192574_11638 [Mucilaginibacter gossypiicola]|uniref:Uncharacterized protein n=1 Tax=Mucilaginibacter gossypiicola TaxID=551995 RepID=A0A1H8TLN2_9SPHI|nr:hypothetical protein [Mucilaginibacter gossypiicola]SEO91706.1 hypothetical protein SAMN05192574_11638 [Mucilaginibacter gossypiicola]